MIISSILAILFVLTGIWLGNLWIALIGIGIFALALYVERDINKGNKS